MCAASTRTTAQLYAAKDRSDPMVNAVPNMLSASLGKRWRAERNFWISFLTFFSWMCATAQSYFTAAISL
jgi:hypothetical protein